MGRPLPFEDLVERFLGIAEAGLGALRLYVSIYIYIYMYTCMYLYVYVYTMIGAGALALFLRGFGCASGSRLLGVSFFSVTYAV